MRIRGFGRRRRDERGSLTVFTVIWSIIMLMLAALAIDGGLAISQRERAADLADQAARTEAEDLSQASLRDGGTAVIQPDGCALAIAYVNSVAATVKHGTATVSGCQYIPDLAVQGAGGQGTVESSAVTVDVQLTYSPFVFDLFTGPLTVTESGTAFAQAGD